MRVLVVDKNPYDLEAACLALSSPDIQVLSADDGEEAKRMVVSEPPRVVVTSSSLGQMGGFALSRDLKALHDQHRIPDIAVIVLLERREDSWLAAWSRCDAFRTKPVDLEDLDGLVRELGTRTQPAPA